MLPTKGHMNTQWFIFTAFGQLSKPQAVWNGSNCRFDSSILACSFAIASILPPQHLKYSHSLSFLFIFLFLSPFFFLLNHISTNLTFPLLTGSFFPDWKTFAQQLEYQACLLLYYGLLLHMRRLPTPRHVPNFFLLYLAICQQNVHAVLLGLAGIMNGPLTFNILLVSCAARQVSSELRLATQ